MGSKKEHTSEDSSSKKQKQSAEKDSRRQARVAAARAKADAAKAAVERRRSLQSGDSANDSRRASRDVYPTEDSAPIVKRRAPAAAAAPETNEAKLERLHREYEQLQRDDEVLDERLQAQSEVITLRRELAVVQEDEERLRKQLAVTKRLVKNHDPEVAKEVAILEDEAQHSSLEKLWGEECKTNYLDKMDWGDINIGNLMSRLEAARRKFTAANERAEGLYARQEDLINVNTDARERAKTEFTETYDDEMANLHDARVHLRQVEGEKAFHRKRGTNRRGQLNVISPEKKTFSRQRRIDDTEGRTTAQVEAMNSQLTDLMEECKVLKKRLDCVRKENGKKKAENEVVLAGIEGEGADARDFKEKLVQENKELMDLKADLQGVLNYVRVKQREEEAL